MFYKYVPYNPVPFMDVFFFLIEPFIDIVPDNTVT